MTITKKYHQIFKAVSGIYAEATPTYSDTFRFSSCFYPSLSSFQNQNQNRLYCHCIALYFPFMGEAERIPAATRQEIGCPPDEPLSRRRANIYSKGPFTPWLASKVNLESAVHTDTGRKCKLHTADAPGPRRIWTRNLFCNCAHCWAILRFIPANDRRKT